MWSDSQMFWIFSNHVGCANKRVLEELSFLTGNTVSMTCQLKGFICSLRVLDHRVTEATCIFKCHYFEKERIRLSWEESLSILGLYLKMNVSSSHCDATWQWIFSVCSKNVCDKTDCILFLIREPESNKCFPDIS